MAETEERCIAVAKDGAKRAVATRKIFVIWISYVNDILKYLSKGQKIYDKDMPF